MWSMACLMLALLVESEKAGTVKNIFSKGGGYSFTFFTKIIKSKNNLACYICFFSF